MKRAILLAAVLLPFLAPPADAHLLRLPDHPKRNHLENRLAQQTENVKHLRYVARHGAGKNQRWHRHMLPIVERERAETVQALTPESPRQLAYRLAAQRGWSAAELDEIIGQESGWNPCRHYPSTTNCDYMGSNACGIPQANPCPHEWRGRLWETRYQQVYWLMRYLESHHGGLPNAVVHKRRTGWY